MTDREAIEKLEHFRESFILCDIAEVIDKILLSYRMKCNELDKKNKEIEFWKVKAEKYIALEEQEKQLYDDMIEEYYKGE